MLLSTSTASPNALYNRDYRRRQREEKSVMHGEMPWHIIRLLIAAGDLREKDARDPRALAAAALKAAIRELKKNG